MRASLILAASFWCLSSSSLCTLCDGHSSKRLPLAGIFGFGSNKEEEQQQQQQQQPNYQSQQYSRQLPPPQQQGGRVQPPPGRRPPPPRTTTGQQQGALSRPTSLVPPQVRNKDPKYPPHRPPPPPPTAKEVVTSEKEEKDGKTSKEENEQSNDVKEEKGVGEVFTELQNTIEQQTTDTITQDANQMPPPPPLPAWGVTSYQEQQQPPPEQQGWMGQYSGWGEPSYYDGQYTDDQYNTGGGGQYMYLQGELDQSLARESDLIGQLDNLTSAVVVMEQREELHVRQLDVLTERVMQVEAESAEDRNLLAEYSANCTMLGQTIATLQEDLEDWQKRCKEFSDRHEEDQEKLAELKNLIKEKERDAEDLAIAMENLRLAERREASRKSQKKKKGLLSWLFSFLISSDDEYEEITKEEAYEMAKSTLLRALNSERSNVFELEAVVASLQQNNSAIAEMVESRDTLIDELNNRIAVFEEDKLVLKAALKQLQKEIQEEAPKAQKLMNDLSAAGEEIKRLNAEVNGIIKTHQEEVITLQKTLSTKQQKISETESNMTTIGTYVDKLEERLTSFAITRRDLEAREAKCKEIEESVVVTETEREKLQAQVDEYAKEQEELKKLLEELALERGSLQKEKRQLLTEQEFRIGEQEQIQAKCATLENEMQTLSRGLQEWKEKCDVLVPALEAAENANAELKSRVQKMDDVEKALKTTSDKNVELQEIKEKVQDELSSVREENERLEALLNETRQELAKEPEDKQYMKRPLHAPKVEVRKVPLRLVRKKLSKATGIHGLLTPSSKIAAKEKGQEPKMQQRPDMHTVPKSRLLLGVAKGIPKVQAPPPPPLLPQEASNKS